MLRRLGFALAAVLLLAAIFFLLSDNPRVVPYRNTAQYWLLRWGGAFDQPSPTVRGTLAGTVRTPLGQPIPNATVLVSRIDGSVSSDETDAQGRYVIDAPVGSYVPVAGAPGFEDTVIHTVFGVGIDANQTTQLDITLQPRQERRITPALEVQIGEPQPVAVQNPLPATAIRREIAYTADGHASPQILYYTPDDGQDTPLPVLLAIYPGPADTWEIVSLPLAQAGYAVIAVWPTYAIDLEPHVDDLERVIALARDGTLPRADGTRIGALGGSYSSLHVLRLAIRDPDEIDAALLLGPPTDAFELRRLFEEGSFNPPFGLDQVLIALGLPNRAPERYWRYSARYHARNIQIPLMLIHSKQDEVVPFTQSELLAQELERLNKPYELIILEGLSHYLYAPEYASEVDDLFQTTTKFFDEQLQSNE